MAEEVPKQKSILKSNSSPGYKYGLESKYPKYGSWIWSSQKLGAGGSATALLADKERRLGLKFDSSSKDGSKKKKKKKGKKGKRSKSKEKVKPVKVIHDLSEMEYVPNPATKKPADYYIQPPPLPLELRFK